MELKSEEKISYDYAIEAAAGSQNSLAGESRPKQQTVARINLGPKIAAILLRILSGAALVAKQKFLEMRFCLRKCFERISSYFVHTPSLANVCTRCH